MHWHKKRKSVNFDLEEGIENGICFACLLCLLCCKRFFKWNLALMMVEFPVKTV